MVAILKFIITYAPLIYLLLALGLLLGLRRLWRARREGRESVYGLEREIAHRHLRQALAILTIIVFLVLAEFIFVIFLAPNLPALSLLPTATINPLSVPTNTLSPELIATIIAAPPISNALVEPSGCVPGQIMITSPKAGDMIKIKSQVILSGSANIPDFGFYKYEFAPSGTDVWTTIQANRVVVEEGELGSWDTTELIAGDLLLRLVVTNNKGQSLPPCVVPIKIVPP